MCRFVKAFVGCLCESTITSCTGPYDLIYSPDGEERIITVNQTLPTGKLISFLFKRLIIVKYYCGL